MMKLTKEEEKIIQLEPPKNLPEDVELIPCMIELPVRPSEEEPFNKVFIQTVAFQGIKTKQIYLFPYQNFLYSNNTKDE